jgi:hypothetical protein
MDPKFDNDEPHDEESDKPTPRGLGITIQWGPMLRFWAILLLVAWVGGALLSHLGH